MGRLEDGLGRVDACHRANVQELKNAIHNQNTHTRTHAHTHQTSEVFVSPHGSYRVSLFFVKNAYQRVIDRLSCLWPVVPTCTASDLH